MRNTLIGMRIADSLGLPAADRSALYYALLLKDVGCSSNAAKIAYLFGGDDQSVKKAGKVVDWSHAGQKMRYVWQQCAPGGSVLDKLLRLGALAKSGPRGEREIVQVRCERGAEITRSLHFPEATAQAILGLDELWNGKGLPLGLKGKEIPLLGRICSLAQTVEIYFTTRGLSAALEMARERRGKWFDPQLVDIVQALGWESSFWASLHGPNLRAELARCEPADSVALADEACLDRVSQAFADVVDAKSPWTFKHSTRVAEIAGRMAEEFGCSLEVKRDIRRAGLLHDVGKLGVSNLILDKPGKLTDEEWTRLRLHPDFSQQILSQIPAFGTLADVASAHHERLDGRGYHRRLDGTSVHWVSRLLAVADIYEALSAERPYRAAMSWDKIQGILARDIGAGVDADCFAALERCQDRFAFESRTEAQFQEVDNLLEAVG